MSPLKSAILIGLNIALGVIASGCKAQLSSNEQTDAAVAELSGSTPPAAVPAPPEEEALPLALVLTATNVSALQSEAGFFWSVGSLQKARTGHKASLVMKGKDAGKILIEGGTFKWSLAWSKDKVDTVELIDMFAGYLNSAIVDEESYKELNEISQDESETIDEAETVRASDKLRRHYSAIRLYDGSYLIVGGYNENTGEMYLDAEIYDPTTEKYTLTTDLKGTSPIASRVLAKYTRLDDDRILITGGIDYKERGEGIRLVEIFDPKTYSFILVSKEGPSIGHTATRTFDGNVVLTGGFFNGAGVVYRFHPKGRTVNIVASGGTAPYLYSIVSGDAQINSETGELYSYSNSPVVVGVTDANGTEAKLDLDVNF